MYLKRHHNIQISKSGVWRILKRLDMSRLPASPRYKRHDKRWKLYEKQLSGHRVQIDVKSIESIASTLGRLTGATSTTSSPPSTTAPVYGSFIMVGRGATRSATAVSRETRALMEGLVGPVSAQSLTSPTATRPSVRFGAFRSRSKVAAQIPYGLDSRPG
jgi:hypothetical protein